MSKGIPLDKIMEKQVTDEESVLSFFRKYSDKAYTIELLQSEYKFSSNIRKVLNRLETSGKLIKTRIDVGKRWEYAYYYAPEVVPNFILKQNSTYSGWEIREMSINDFLIDIEFITNKKDDLFGFKIEFPNSGDAAVYYEDEDEKTRCIRYSEINNELTRKDNSVVLWLDFNQVNHPEETNWEDWEFEYSTAEKEIFVSSSRRQVKAKEIMQYFGSLGYKIEFFSERNQFEITAYEWNPNDEEDESWIIDHVNFGFDPKNNTAETIIEDCTKVVVTY